MAPKREDEQAWLEGDMQAGTATGCTPRGDGILRTAGPQSWSQVRHILSWICAGILCQPWGTVTNPPPTVPHQLRVGTGPHLERTRWGIHRGGSRTEGQHVTRTHRTRGSSGSCCHNPPGTAQGSTWKRPKSTHTKGTGAGLGTWQGCSQARAGPLSSCGASPAGLGSSGSAKRQKRSLRYLG